jgi:CBS domain-containing protein
MAATIDDLLQGKPAPVTTKVEDPLAAALELMVQHDYGQLPVVDGNHKVAAILTADSIVRTLNNFGVPPGALRVRDAMHERFKTCRADIDLLDILDDLQTAGAVLVLDAHNALIGIVTTYDTTEYFRRRTQDIMLVQDIEELVKDYVLAAFQGEGDVTADAQLHAAIEEITPSNSTELRKPFQKALEHYLHLSGNGAPGFDGKIAGQAFEQHLYRKGEVKAFDKLSLNEYIELFLHKSRWSIYDAALRIERDALHRLLSRVRSTRNDLAHFRIDISEQKREELRFCRDWLGRQEDAVVAAFARNVPAPPPAAVAMDVAPSAPIPAVPNEPAPPIAPLDEVSRPEDSRYSSLASWLQQQPPSVEQIAVPFTLIEQIISDKLPASAREHRSWWANDSTRHVQSKQWLHAGWRMANVNLRGETVVFARNKERERAYIDFFSSTIDALRKTGAFTFEASPIGLSWLTIAPLPDIVPRIAYLNLSFARTKQLRVELYIDSGDKAKNKRIFDELYSHKEEIEAALGEPLSWERISEKRACRIAIYYPGSITDDASSLAELRSKAIAGLVRFRQVMTDNLARTHEANKGGAVG